MPSAERLARRSVALLARQGLPRGQAAEVIIHVCDDAAHRLYLHDHDADTSWLSALRAEARRIWLAEVHNVLGDDPGAPSGAVARYLANVTQAADRWREWPPHRPPRA